MVVQIFASCQADPSIGALIDDSLVLVIRDLNEREDLRGLVSRLDGFREKMNGVFSR